MLGGFSTKQLLERPRLNLRAEDGPTGYQKLEIQITADSRGFSKKMPICEM